ncbi:MAG: hypothetical protein ACXAB7_11290 [Candidatus Kariarchaeaceae archaeon]|jgi:hypothetical protein
MYNTDTSTQKSNLSDLKTKQKAILLLHWLIGWILCAATINIGFALTSEMNALIIHAIAAPIFFSIVSFNYFTKYNFTTPLQTATIFMSMIILADALLVAPVFEKSYEMFTNFLGTWLVFILIFGATYLTGRYLEEK